MDKAVGSDWKKLEDNIMGEFGWLEVLKQFLGETKATPVAEGWDGDRYQVYEQKQSKKLLLIARVRLASEEQCTDFFASYSAALEKKYPERAHLFRRANLFSFSTPTGSVFLRCFGQECITLEGGDRTLFLRWNKKLGWEAIPDEPKKPDDSGEKSRQCFCFSSSTSFLNPLSSRSVSS